MKHFQNIFTCLLFLTINLLFLQTDLLSQNDSLEKKDSLFIGGLYKLKFMNGEESFNEIQSYDSTSIKIMFKDSLIRIKRSNIKSIEEYTYTLHVCMREKDKESSLPEVTLTTQDLKIFHGKLLSVKPVKYDELNKQDNTGQQIKVLEIERDKIMSVKIHGESEVPKYLGYGALIGAGIGAIIGYATGDDHVETGGGLFRFDFTYTAEQKALNGGLLGGLLGGVIGLIVGITNSKPDEIIKIGFDDDYDKLIKYLKYPEDNLPINSDYK